MLGRLAEGELSVGELAEPLTMSAAAASKHIQVLERVGLVRRTVDGRRHVCHLEPAPLASTSAWLRFYERHWEERLDALEALFRATPTAWEESTVGHVLDQPRFVMPDGSFLPIRLTGVLPREDELWKTVHLHVSIGVPDEAIQPPGASGAGSAPSSI